MYIRRIELENSGPVEHINFQFPFNADQNPLPVLFVGQNGAGKSILLSHIVNAMVDAKASVYKDSEVMEGKVYKLRSSEYITHGKDFSRGYVHFDDDFFLGEIQAECFRKDFERLKGYTPADKNWAQMGESEASIFKSNFRERTVALRQNLSHFTSLYFPANRFEEPAWLNVENLQNTTSYASAVRYRDISGRKIVNDSPLRENQSWLLDVVYDSFAIERRSYPLNITGMNIEIMQQTDGPASKIRRSIEDFIRKLIRTEGEISWSVGARGRRSISLHVSGRPLIPNLYSLSTGQTGLLNIFLTLIRDCDMSSTEFISLGDIRATVVIDEVDLHLHTELQHSVLPELIALFPKVQFILTTHSPLFILGLEKKLGADGFALVELPHGNQISVERFSEFKVAYEHFKESSQFEHDVRSAVIESQTPILFTEGTIDIDYINRAADLLNRQTTIQKFRLLDANGYGGLDKIWKHFDTNIASLNNQRVTLLYDCDVSKTPSSKPGVSRITLPLKPHRISKGIENLFDDSTINAVRAANLAFIDITPTVQKIVRGVTVTEPESWDINPNEKRNLANWLIENGTAEQFANFSILFDLIDEAYQQLNSNK